MSYCLSSRYGSRRKQLRAACALLLSAFLLLSMTGYAQSNTALSGKVVDTKNQPVPGVSVVVQNTTLGTVTLADGTFQLQVPATAINLVFSNVGFVSQVVPVAGKTTIDITLLEDSKALQEVVVVGYGTQRKQDLTGAVAIADVKALKSQPAASATEALQGKVAGVNIVNDGSPGSTPQIRIRGYSTINSNEPLYIIDGVPYQGKLSWFNQNDIQTLQVLKDASSASIYGSRANNGVVIITTKKGKEGPAQITFDSYYGISTPIRSRFPQFLNPQQYADYLFQGYTNAGLNPGDYLGDQYGKGATAVLPEYLRAGSATGQNVTPADADPAKYSNDPANYYQITRASKTGTDWMRAITRSAPVQSYQLGASGGSKNTTYAFSLGYQDQQGILKYTDFKRYSLRANVQTSAFDNHFRFGENVLFSRTEGTGFSTNNNTPGDYLIEDNPVNSVYKQQTIIPLYDIAGNFAGSQGTGLGDGKQPLAQLFRAKDDFTKENRFFGNIFAEADIVKGLVARTSFGVNLNNFNSQALRYPNLETSPASSVNGYAATQGYGTQWTWTNTLSYKRSFSRDQELSVLVGSEAISTDFRNLSGSRNGYFLLGSQDYYYLNSGSTNISNAEVGGISTLSSLFGRVDYSFKDKYLAGATLRRDGSSNFGAANRYGYFPAASVAWRLSSEPFLASVKWLQDLKVRYGYGQTGNQNIPANNAIDVYQSLNTISYYPLSGSNTLVPGAAQVQIGNPLLKWETLKSSNLGVDFSVLNGSIDGSVDVYSRTTDGVLFPITLPAQTGGLVNSPYVNAGTMRNRGIELVLNYHYTAKSDRTITVDVGVNLAANRNTILQLAPGIQNAPYGNFRSLTTTIFQVGKPYGEFYGYKVAGIFQSADEVAGSTQPGARIGGIKFADANGDGAFSADDRTTLGSPLPKFTYGTNLNIGYKNFDLAAFFYGSQGNKIYNIQKYYTDFQAFPSAASTRLLDAWSPTNTGSLIPSPSARSSALEYQSSSYYVENGSYLRLRNLQLGYAIKPTSLVSKLGISRLRVYGSVTNLFTITKYSGLDPEVTQVNQGFSLPGLDFGVYPSPRQFIVGLNASF